MTRGKYAARANLRREDAEVRGTLDGYQHHVARLTAELAQVKQARAAERKAFKAETRRLAAELAEGLSPEVKALRAELERQRETARAAKADAAETRRRWTEVLARLRRMFYALGLTKVEAWEVVLSLCGARLDSDDPTLLVDDILGVHRGAPLTREQALAVQAARQQRHGTDIVKLLHAKIREAEEAGAE
jgi:hypothetical protein